MSKSFHTKKTLKRRINAEILSENEDPILDYAIYYAVNGTYPNKLTIYYAINGTYPNELTKENKRAVRKKAGKL